MRASTAALNSRMKEHNCTGFQDEGIYYCLELLNKEIYYRLDFQDDGLYYYYYYIIILLLYIIIIIILLLGNPAQVT